MYKSVTKNKQLTVLGANMSSDNRWKVGVHILLYTIFGHGIEQRK
jgi:hypothetical protein